MSIVQSPRPGKPSRPQVPMEEQMEKTDNPEAAADGVHLEPTRPGDAEAFKGEGEADEESESMSEADAEEAMGAESHAPVKKAAPPFPPKKQGERFGGQPAQQEQAKDAGPAPSKGPPTPPKKEDEAPAEDAAPAEQEAKPAFGGKPKKPMHDEHEQHVAEAMGHMEKAKGADGHKEKIAHLHAARKSYDKAAATAKDPATAKRHRDNASWAHGAIEGMQSVSKSAKAVKPMALEAWLAKAVGSIPGAEDDESTPNMGSKPQLENTRSGSGQSDGIPGASDDSEGHDPYELAQGEPDMEPSDANGEDLASAASDDYGAGKVGPNGPGKMSDVGDTAGMSDSESGQTSSLSKDDPKYGEIDSGEPGVVEEDAELEGNDQMDVGSIKDRSALNKAGALDGYTRFPSMLDPAALDSERKRAAAVWNIHKSRESTYGMGVATPTRSRPAPVDAPMVKAQGQVIYSDASDLAVERLLKSDPYYAGGAAPEMPGTGMQKTSMCKMCKAEMPAFLTACPGCGVSQTAMSSSTPVGAGGDMVKSQRAMPVASKLAPTRVRGDVYAPGGLRFSK